MAFKPARVLKSGVQRTLFSLEQFSRHEMANHAAAGAYSFLLSALPALLVILYISTLLARTFGMDAQSAYGALGSFLDAFGGKELIGPLLERPIASVAGAFGIINLIWAARVFVLSIQRGVRVVYAGSASVNPVRENVLTFAVELVVLVAAIILIAGAQIARAILSAIDWPFMRELAGRLVGLGLRVIPMAALWLFVFLTYLNVPPKRPRRGNAFVTSLLCVAIYLGLSAVLGAILDTSRYGILYGLLGNLIAGLIKVYSFFWFYFFFAEFCYTLENYDSLLFARFHRLDTADKAPNALERRLFSAPQRLFRKYAREYAPGEPVFAKGDQGDEAYYLYKGSVSVYLEDPETGCAPVTRVREGEFFGEMAGFLKEGRSAWTRAEGEATIFRLPAAMFKQILTQDPAASMRLVGIMAERLAANNQLISGDGSAGSGP